MSGNRILQWSSRSGNPVQAGHWEVTPVSQALVFKVPYFGFVWNRPIAVRVTDDLGTRTIPIRDITRLTQVGFLAVVLAFALLAWIASRGVSNRK